MGYWTSVIILSLETLSLRNLSSKLATLLLLITGQRIQTIHSICIDNLIDTLSSVKILITNEIKTSGTNVTQPCLYIPYFKENPALCVASILKFYINKTAGFRKPDQKKLFLTSRSPYLTASKETIIRCVKQTMCNADIKTSIFKPHSTRHASTSKAFLSGVSLDTIRQTAGWSQSSNTLLYYTFTIARF